MFEIHLPAYLFAGVTALIFVVNAVEIGRLRALGVAPLARVSRRRQIMTICYAIASGFIAFACIVLMTWARHQPHAQAWSVCLLLAALMIVTRVQAVFEADKADNYITVAGNMSLAFALAVPATEFGHYMFGGDGWLMADTFCQGLAGFFAVVMFLRVTSEAHGWSNEVPSMRAGSSR
jgi:hypothetical protein